MPWADWTPILSAITGGAAVVGGSFYVQQATLKREALLRVWQAKQQVYEGALDALGEVRALAANIQEMNEILKDLNDMERNVESSLSIPRPDTDDHEALRIFGRIERRREVLVERLWDEKRKLGMARAKLYAWEARVSVVGTTAAAHGFSVCVGLSEDPDEGYSSTLASLSREIAHDLSQFWKLHSDRKLRALSAGRSQ